MRSLLQSAQALVSGAADQALFQLSSACVLPRSHAECAVGDPIPDAGGTDDACLRAAYAHLFDVPGLPAPLVLMVPQEADAVPDVRIGYGQAASLQPSGPDCGAQLLRQGQALLRSLQVLGTTMEAPCLYGALQFDPGSSRDLRCDKDSPWHGLPDAHFVLPRWLLHLRGRRGVLQLIATARELRQPDAFLRELEAIEAALHAAGAANGHGNAQPALDDFQTKTLRTSQASWAALDSQRWQQLVTAALQHIAAGDLAKVVLARMQTVQLDDGQSFDWTSALTWLDAAYPSCLRFALPLPGAVFVGATPELLVARQGSVVSCDALAGSRPCAPDAGTLESISQALLHDEKEAREHAYVVAAIRERLQVLGDVLAPASPGLRVLRNVVHLWTPLTVTLRAPVHILSLLADLHPTPAVCGVPRDAAAEFIAQKEALPRGFYAAPIGWFDADGQGTFFVAIRSALVQRDRAWLFAGAGIVAGSDADRERIETAAKLRPMLGALGLPEPGLLQRTA